MPLMAAVQVLHSWDVTVAEARDIQMSLRERIVFEPPSNFAPRYVAGADVAFEKSRDLSFAAIVLIDLETMRTVETASAVVPIAFPYVPGYLSFRELPALATRGSAWSESPMWL